MYEEAGHALKARTLWQGKGNFSGADHGLDAQKQVNQACRACRDLALTWWATNDVHHTYAEDEKAQ